MQLKPQEIYILFAIANSHEEWTFESLGAELTLAPSQVFKSLERAEQAQLYVKARRRVIRRNLLEFVVHGLRYAFPATVGPIQRGFAADWRAPGLGEFMVSDSEDSFVWPHPQGTHRGQAIAPLHESLPAFAVQDPRLHAQYALVELLRVGGARERQVAAELLENRFGLEAPPVDQ